MSKGKTPAALILAAALLLALGAFAAEEKQEKKDAEPKKGDIEYVDVDEPEEGGTPTVERKEQPAKDAIAGRVTMSDDSQVEGGISLTAESVLKFYDPGTKKLLRFRLEELTHIEQKPLVEEYEKEWRWKENASDEKVYTGRTYPWRKLSTTLHLKDGRTLTGEMNALLFVTNANGSQRVLIHKRQKGKLDTKLEELLYAKLVDFRPPEKKDEKPPEGEKESDSQKTGD